VTAHDEAQAHLEKAREFLKAASTNHELGMLNAAVSNAVTAGINAKDVVCLLTTGRTGKTQNHLQALAELKASGPAGRRLEPTLGRLLRLKSRAQYLADPVSTAEAAKSLTWARRMVTEAAELLAS
jgi:uncharacterized protein (UPF0332 family)